MAQQQHLYEHGNNKNVRAQGYPQPFRQFEDFLV